MLMLSHAFAAGAVRVQFRVDSRNQLTQAAITKLGAVREGVLRHDLLRWTGYIRDTVVFSILYRAGVPLVDTIPCDRGNRLAPWLAPSCDANCARSGRAGCYG